MATEKDFDQQIDDHSGDSVTEVAERPGLSRRKFTRNALVGSAVLLTLSNRSAWGTKELICASASLLESYRTANPSRLTEEELNEIYTYDAYYGERKDEPSYDPQTGDMCYERNTSNQNSELQDNVSSPKKLWFD